jgi:hypothetical protein
VDSIGYVAAVSNGYIDVTHLCSKHALDFETWLARAESRRLIAQYAQITGFKEHQLVCRNAETNNVYVLPGICINFLNDVEPVIGEVIQIMIEAIGKKAQVDVKPNSS